MRDKRREREMCDTGESKGSPRVRVKPSESITGNERAGKQAMQSVKLRYVSKWYFER